MWSPCKSVATTTATSASFWSYFFPESEFLRIVAQQTAAKHRGCSRDSVSCVCYCSQSCVSGFNVLSQTFITQRQRKQSRECGVQRLCMYVYRVAQKQ